MGAPWERFIRREGITRGVMPLHMTKVRSDRDRKVRRMREHASLGARRERDHRTKPLTPEAGL